MEAREGLIPKPEHVLNFALKHVIGQSETSQNPIARDAWKLISQDPLQETVIKEAINRYQQTPKRRKRETVPTLTGALTPIFNKLWETYTPEQLTSPPPQTQQEP